MIPLISLILRAFLRTDLKFLVLLFGPLLMLTEVTVFFLSYASTIGFRKRLLWSSWGTRMNLLVT